MLTNTSTATIEPSQLDLELEELLAGAMEEKGKRDAATKRAYITGNPGTGSINPPTLVEYPHYKVELTAAIFIRSRCSKCGEMEMRFSHFAEFHTFSQKLAGKPSRWQRVDKIPEGIELAAPRYIEVTVAGCMECVSAIGAVKLNSAETIDNHRLQQLSILDAITAIAAMQQGEES